MSFWVFFRFIDRVCESFAFRLSYGLFQLFSVLCVSLDIFSCGVLYSFGVKFMLSLYLFAVFWCAPRFSSWFGLFFMSFDCLLYRCLNVV